MKALFWGILFLIEMMLTITKYITKIHHEIFKEIFNALSKSVEVRFFMSLILAREVRKIGAKWHQRRVQINLGGCHLWRGATKFGVFGARHLRDVIEETQTTGSERQRMIFEGIRR